MKNNIEVFNLIKESINKDNLFCPHCVDAEYDYYSDRSLSKLSQDIACVFDKSALHGESRNLLEGCYHRCLLDRKSSKPKNLIILENKDIFINSIDVLINFLEEDCEWSKKKKRESLLSDDNKSKLKQWKDGKKIENKKIHEANMLRNLEKQRNNL